MNTVTRFAVPRFAATATLVLAMGALAACGSDDADADDEDTPADAALPTVTKAEFVEQGNALCRANGEAIGSMFAAMSQPPKPEELAAAYDTMLRESYKITGDVLAIGAPAGQERELLDLLVEMHEVTSQVDEKGAEAFFADSSDPWAAATEKLANDFGLTDCQHEE